MEGQLTGGTGSGPQTVLDSSNTKLTPIILQWKAVFSVGVDFV